MVFCYSVAALSDDCGTTLKTSFGVYLKFCALIALNTISSNSIAVNADGIEHIEVKGSRYKHELVTIVNEQVQADQITVLPEIFADWLSSTPGVTFNGQGGHFQSYSIRGFSKSRIKTEVNGVPMLTDRRAGNSVAFLPSEFIETVDIRKGPSASYYGSDAMGGVISTQLSHFDSPYFSAKFQPSNQQHSIIVAHGNELVSGALSYSSGDQSRAENGELLNDAFQNISGMLNTNYQVDDVLLTGSLLISQGDDIGKSSVQFPDDRITVYLFDNHVIANMAIEHERFGQLLLGLHDQHWQSDITRLADRQNITDYQSQTFNLLWRTDFSGLYGFQLPQKNSESFGGKWGIEWVKRNNVNISEQEFTLSEALVYQQTLVDGEQGNLALFAHQYGQWQAWHWSFAARADYIEQHQHLNTKVRVDDTYTSISFSVNRSFSERLSVHAEAGNSFRFATLSERFFDGETPRGSTQGNANLLPEESIGGQFTINYEVDSNLTLDVSSYYYQVDHYIERYNVSEDLLTYRNVEQADIYGFESSLDWQMSEYFHHRLSYQYNRGEKSNGIALDDLNPDEINWRIQGYWSDWQLSNQLSYRFEKSAVGPSEITLESVLLWHMNAKWQVNKNWQLGLFFNNLTNELYRASADEDAPWQSERSIAFSVSYQP